MAETNIDDIQEALVQRRGEVFYNIPEIEKKESETIGGPSPSYIPLLRIDKYGQHVRRTGPNLTGKVDNVLGMLSENERCPGTVQYATLLVRLKENQKSEGSSKSAQAYAPMVV